MGVLAALPMILMVFDDIEAMHGYPWRLSSYLFVLYMNVPAQRFQSPSSIDFIRLLARLFA